MDAVMNWLDFVRSKVKGQVVKGVNTLILATVDKNTHIGDH